MRLTFGACSFDRERRELTRDGSPVHAGPQLLQLLELLIDASPSALTKDEIHRSLWPATFVSDGTLTSLIAALRDAIGDDARSSRLVRTIHGYGYLFCGDVVAEADADTPRPGQPACRIIAGDRDIGLPPGEHILGRATDAAVFVDDVGVSRHHARIVVSSTGATLEDLGSKNGTMLDGRPIEGRCTLTDGAAIVLGSTSLRFRLASAEASTATVTRQRPLHE
jgi:DNA-binding winged helix-turn-helix (wHTH) protein